MYKRLSLFVLILGLFTMAGCTSTPDKTVDAFFTDLKQAKISELGKYTDAPLFESTIEEAELKLLSTYFATLTYSAPKELSKTDTEASYDVAVTAVDLSTVVQSILMEAIAAETSAEGDNATAGFTDDELDAKLLAALSSPDSPQKRVALTINMQKLNGTWKIIVDDALRAGIFVQEPMTDEEFSYEAFEFEVIGSETAEVTYTSEVVEGVCAFMKDGVEIYAECDPAQAQALESTKGQTISISYDVYSDVADAGEGNASEYFSLTAIN